MSQGQIYGSWFFQSTIGTSLGTNELDNFWT